MFNTAGVLTAETLKKIWGVVLVAVLLGQAASCVAEDEAIFVFTTQNQTPRATDLALNQGVEIGSRVGASVGAGVVGGVVAAGISAAILSGDDIPVFVMRKDWLGLCATDIYKIKPENIRDDLEPLAWYVIAKNDKDEWVIKKPDTAQRPQIEAHSCWARYKTRMDIEARKKQ